MTRDPITLEASLLRIWLAKLGAAKVDAIGIDDLVDHLDDRIENFRIRREMAATDDLERLCRPEVRPLTALADADLETLESALASHIYESLDAEPRPTRKDLVRSFEGAIRLWVLARDEQTRREAGE